MDASIAAAIRALDAGRVVVYPTETVYGLAVDAASPAAIDELFRIKGRPAAKGISVLVDGLASAAPFVAGEIPAGALRLADAFWPGPLTIVLPASAEVEPRIKGPAGGIGLRCSPDPYARALTAGFGRPVTATSANPAGAPPAEDIETARKYFAERVAAYVDGGKRESVSISSVVEFFPDRAILRRVGAIGMSALSSITSIDPMEH